MISKERLLTPGKTWREQFVRYFVVGGIATVFDWAISFALNFLGVWSSANGVFSGLEGILCDACGFSVGLCVNYALSVTVVFDNRSMKNVWHERIIFVAIALIGLALHSAIIWFCQNRLGFRFETAKPTATALTLIWNFLSKKLTIFR
ncbi:MAG: GtrA family protein [Kiritimatiellae bacterium]|nr:GtrA family protein [Kiritimatiellia bacterium]